MFRLTFAVTLFAVAAFSFAQAPNFTELKSQNPVRVSGDELKALLPGAKVVSRTNEGSSRSWQNRADGTFSASSDGRGQRGGRNAFASAQGTWHVDEKGRWCATIPWDTIHEEWCRYIFKAGEKYYGYGAMEDGARGSEFEISR